MLAFEAAIFREPVTITGLLFGPELPDPTSPSKEALPGTGNILILFGIELQEKFAAEAE